MQVSDFDFELPEHLIAKKPLQQRDASRLLCLASSDDAIVDAMIRDLPALVKPGDLWVLNDTRVIPARLVGVKPSGGKVEVLLLEPAGENHIWLAWGKSNKPLKPGTVVNFSDEFSAEVLSRDGKNIEVLLRADDVAAAIEVHGHMPLPPYIDRPDSEEDKERYQTVFARHAGAVAAPTAGLHLTAELMAAMQDAGASFAHVTLHVGPGTFQPVQVDDVDSHVMHEEAYIVPAETAAQVNLAKAEGRRVVAVGTTSLRTLEAASAGGELKAGAGRTSIFIYPGYHFQIVDALLTNFHLPKSTLIMLVAALAGRDRVLAAYAHAREEEYRFYSYGDAMFVPRRCES
ncbi:S-adenosylmethionine:tRNA ribosyltransferase-isomerase [Mariprofundus aestuarium]|uniref:S-adenosylmethionine:tRNA ribosyltransferase-isomerase n=1 Tax=Mariprofundus aestuarium TaxID=1921086 RepID=A0A2K8KWE7_MARES|nr:tRNA preQ1(34) S-adenosylmethionine ribosyltransferase-isomerase QueA [Mariprofundus aestuarium]ATX79187.1 S-adenosylmethionine:tRNA ribosyltransferase-isomerase [Mariprofundus aestuarium]